MKLCTITPADAGAIELRVYDIKSHCQPFFWPLKASAEILPRVASINGSRQRCGTDLRCHHFSMALSRTPRLRAVVLTSVQSSLAMTITHTDVSSVTQHPFGGGADISTVVKCLMITKKETKRERTLRIKAQFKREREARGWSQAQLAGYLDVSKANYEKYEGPPDKDGKLRAFPIDVIIDFTRLINADLDHFLTAEARQSRRARTIER
jgi:hypothetical protein